MTSNFLQVGRTQQCGHCNPAEFGEGLKTAMKVHPNYKCECVCHDKPLCRCGNDLYHKGKCQKHTCCDGECNHDDCCAKVPANCPNMKNPISEMFEGKNSSLRKTYDEATRCTHKWKRYNPWIDECTLCGEIKDFKVALTGDKGCPHLHLEDMQAFLPMFIDAEFKKGKSKDRGAAILHVALFLDWCKKNIKIK